METKKKLLAVVGFILILSLFSSTSQAESMYVTDVLKLTVRYEKGSDQNILTVIQSGQVVEILQTDDKWAQVRLPDGREGWVLSRYLTPRETDGIKLENFRKKYKALTSQTAELLEENTKLKAENKELSRELNQIRKTIDDLSKSYESLKTEAADYLNLKAKYTQTNAQLSEKTQLAEKLRQEIERLETRQIIRWFLSGAGVLFLGFIIGFSAKRQRRRSSLIS